MSKIKKYFLNLWYGLPFGMKAADTEIMGNKSVDDNGVTIQQEVSDQRVAKHLLKVQRHCITDWNFFGMYIRCQKGERCGRNHYRRRNGRTCSFPGIFQYRCSYFYFTQYRTSYAFCELWINFINELVYRNRVCFERQISGTKK